MWPGADWTLSGQWAVGGRAAHVDSCPCRAKIHAWKEIRSTFPAMIASDEAACCFVSDLSC